MRITTQLSILGFVLLNPLWVQTCIAAKWDIKPDISLREVYSDNIFLESTNESNDLVTELSPSLVLSADGNRVDLQFSYSMQNLAYQDHTERNDTNHRLQTLLKSELVKDLIFFDANARVGQQLVNIRDGVSVDQISGSQNSEDVYSYSLSPSFKPKIGNFLLADLRYTYDYVDSENDNGNNLNSSDSTGDNLRASLKNGSSTGNLFWNLDYNSREIDYTQGDRTDTEVLQGSIGLRLTRSFSINVSGTDENNEFIGDRGNSSPDDSYYGGGFSWTPSRNFNLSISYNKRTDPRPNEDENFISGSLSWTPTVRTNISAKYGNRFFGETYDFSLSHQMRRSSWQIAYSESVSDFRDQLLNQELIGTLVCPLGSSDIQQCRLFNPNDPPKIDEQLIGILGGQSSISNNTYINKRLNASWSISGAKNIITLGVSNQQRDYIGDGASEREFDVNLTWSYKLAPKTTSLISVEQGENKYEDSEKGTDLSLRWSLTTNITAKSTLSAEIYYSDRDADTSLRAYTENRFTISFQHFF